MWVHRASRAALQWGVWSMGSLALPQGIAIATFVILCAAYVLLVPLEQNMSYDDVHNAEPRCSRCWRMCVCRSSRAALQWGVGSMGTLTLP